MPISELVIRDSDSTMCCWRPVISIQQWYDRSCTQQSNRPVQ